MATYTRPDKFVPVNISSDPSAYLGYVQKRADLEATGQAIVQNQFKQLLDLQLTHDSNKEKLNGFLKQASEKVAGFTNKDLSDYNNVKEALNIFNPLLKEEQYQSVLYDNQYTRHYKEQLALAEKYKQQVDKQGNIGSGYSDSNYTVLYNAYNKFASSTNPNDVNAWGKKETYQPYYDYKDEYRGLVSEFLKQPDEFEIEKLDPSTGLTQKTKYQGKSADQIQRYIDATLSEKARSQIRIEGRAASYNLTDEQFEKMYSSNLDLNIKNLQSRIDDLDVYKSEGGKRLTPEQIEERKNDYKSQIKDLEAKREEIVNPKTRQGIFTQKEHIYANYFEQEKLAKLALSTDNKRPSITYGTNQAYVSLLNRNQNFRQFMMEMEMKDRHAQMKYGIEMRKLGLNPDGTPVTAAQSGYETISPTPITGTIDETVNRIKEEEAKLDGDISTFVKDSAKDAALALGLSPTADPTKDMESAKQMFSYVSHLAENRNSAQNSRIVNTPDNQLTAREQATKRILLKLREQDAKVDYANNYYKRKAEFQQSAREQLLGDIKSKGITLEQINDNSYESGIGQYAGRTLTFAGPMFQEFGKSVLGPLADMATRSKKEFSSLEEFADYALNNPEFAKQVSSRFESGTFSWGSPDPVTKKPLYGYASYPKLDLNPYVKGFNESVANTLFTNGMTTTHSKPVEQKTASDKEAASRFYQEGLGIIAKFKDVYPELQQLNPQSLQRINYDHELGKVRLEFSDVTYDEKTGKYKLQSSETKTVVIDDASVKRATDVDLNYLRAINMSSNGILQKEYTSPSSLKYNYRLRTASGKPTTGTDPLMLEIDLEGNGQYHQIPAPPLVSPTDAIDLFEKGILKIEQRIVNMVLQDRKKAGNLQNADKINTSELNSEIKSAIYRSVKNGTFYRGLDMGNPNISSWDQYILDQVDILSR